LPRNDQWKAPTPDLEGHRKRLREALGNTLSDEFVDVILGKLVEALRPGLYDQLDKATLNAALATIDSMQPRSELQAVLAVQIIATGSAGLRFLRQSHRHMTEDFINVYGNYAIKLLRLQNEMIQTFDKAGGSFLRKDRYVGTPSFDVLLARERRRLWPVRLIRCASITCVRVPAGGRGTMRSISFNRRRIAGIGTVSRAWRFLR
jgi:hypothetical protein